MVEITTLGFTAEGTQGLDNVLRSLADAGQTIPYEAVRVLRDLTRQLADTAAGRVMYEPTHGTKHTGLRAEVAAGVGVSDTDIGARVTTSMPPGKEIIPRGFDTAFGGHWRHPLFGDMNRWYQNYGAFSWFMGTMQDGATEGRAMLQAVLEQAAANIRSGT